MCVIRMYCDNVDRFEEKRNVLDMKEVIYMIFVKIWIFRYLLMLDVFSIRLIILVLFSDLC